MLRVGVASGVCEQGVRSDTTELFEEFHQETRRGYRGRISAVGGGRHDGDNGGRHERLGGCCCTSTTTYKSFRARSRH